MTTKTVLIGRRASGRRGVGCAPRVLHSVSFRSICEAIFAVVLLGAGSSQVYAQGISSGLGFLKIPVSARSAALGESVVAERGRLSSFALNPATVAATSGVEFLLLHTEWVQGVSAEHLFAAFPTSIGSIGVGVGLTSVGDIEVRDKPGPPVSLFSARGATVQTIYANEISTRISVGITTKLLYQKIYVDESLGAAFDVGLLYHSFLPGLSLGVSATNIGSAGRLREAQADLPRQIRLGVGFSRSVDVFNLSMAAQLTKLSELSQLHLSIGGEIEYDERVALRLGYQDGYETRRFTAGIGVRYAVVRFDYGYLPFSLGFGSAHLLSLGFNL